MRLPSTRLSACLALVCALTACSGEDGGPPIGNFPTAGSGGGAQSGGTAGSGASSSGASGGGSGSGGVAGGGGSIGGGGAGSGGVAGGGGAAGSNGQSGAAVACPTDKTFCSGFEETTLPAGAVYKVNAAPGDWSRDFEVDSTVFKSGKSSLKLKDPSGSGSSYQMLAVPAPAGKFWARFYIRQADADIGIVDHNVFAGASDTDETNSSVMIEFAEDVGVSLNTSDDVRWPTGFGRILGEVKPLTLAKGVWHCIELSYDGVARAQQLYVNGELKIDATDYPKTVAKPLAFFKFGFNKLHGPARAIWYDDVAVGPTRPGCL
jgi:hypothetical protein